MSVDVVPDRGVPPCRVSSLHLPPLAPTDSPRSPSTIERWSWFGIDTIRLRGPVPADAFVAGTRQYFKVEANRQTGELPPPKPSFSRLELPSGLHLEIKRIKGRPTASIELSAPRRLRGDNCEPASPAEVAVAVASAFDEASEYVDWECGLSDLEVTRLDIARDFQEVTVPAMVLEQLSHVPAARVNTAVRRTADCAGAQTLYRETDRWLVRLYDRGAMYADTLAGQGSGDRWSAKARLAQTERGKVRYELQLRARLLKQLGLTRVRDLDDLLLQGLSGSYFDRAALGAVVGGAAARVRHGALRAEAIGASEYKAYGLALAQAVCDGLGLAPFASPNTVRKHRAAAVAYGLASANVFEDGPLRRLDLESGRLVSVGVDEDGARLQAA